MNTIIQILYTDSWRELAGIVLPNYINYSHKHGYHLYPQIIPEPYNGFDKLRAIKINFERGYEIVFSVDLDTMIMNHKYKIEDFMDDENDFFICRDCNGLNAGSFIVRRSGWSEVFIESLLTREGGEGMYCEQNAIESIAPLILYDKIKILPHPSINSYLYENYPDISPKTHEEGQWEEGDFLLHLPGLGLEKRKQILEETKQYIIYE